MATTQTAAEALGIDPADPLADIPVVTVADEPNPLRDPAPKLPEGPGIISDDGLEEFMQGGKAPEPKKEPEQQQKTEAKTEPPPAPDQNALKLMPETLVIDPLDGKVKPFKSIDGERMLRQDHDRRVTELKGKEDLVMQNFQYLDAASKSKAATIMVNALAAGASEMDALEMAAKIVGRTVAAPPAPEDLDPRPDAPDEDVDPSSKEYYEWFKEDTAWQMRQEARKETEKRMAPIIAENERLRREAAERDQRQAQAVADRERIAQANRTGLSNVIHTVVPEFDSLDGEKQKQIVNIIDRAGERIGLSAVATQRPFSEAEMLALKEIAFPNGNPFTAAAPTPPTPQAPESAPQPKQPLQPGVSTGSELKTMPSWASGNQATEKVRVQSILEDMAKNGI